MDGDEALGDRTRAGEHRGRSGAVDLEGSGILGGLLRDVRVKRNPTLCRPRRDGGRRFGIDRTDAVDRRSDPRPGVFRELGHAVDPPVRIAVGKAPLNRARLLPDPAVQEAGIEERDPDAGIASGLDHRLSHLVRIRIRHAARTVVEVVELADAGDPGKRHLAEGGASEREIEVWVQARREAVHRIAPGPEVPPTRLRSAAQRPLEGMGVGVGQPRDRDSVEPVGTGRRRRCAGLDCGDALVPDLDRHPLRDPVVAEPGELTPVHAHDPASATISRARASNSARWWRSKCSQPERVRGWARSTKSTPSRWSTSCWKVPAVRPRLISSCSTPSRSRYRTRTLRWRSRYPLRSDTERQPSLISTSSWSTGSITGFTITHSGIGGLYG